MARPDFYTWWCSWLHGSLVTDADNDVDKFDLTSVKTHVTFCLNKAKQRESIDAYAAWHSPENENN